MIQHNLKVAFRNLLKYKVQMGISIIGLSAGFVCLSLSLLWIRYETSYDSFHEEADLIYLTSGSKHQEPGRFDYFSDNLLYHYLVKSCPEVKAASRVIPVNTEFTKVRYKENELQTSEIGVDSNFISMFNITVLEGNIPLHLSKNQMVITDKLAKQIFGKESPLGKELTFPQRNNLKKTIVAVVKSWEEPSLISFDILNLESEERDNVLGYTLFRVYPNSDIEKMKRRLEKATVILHDGYELSVSTSIAPLAKLRSLYPKEDLNVKMDHIRMFALIGALVVICGLCNYFATLITRIRMRKREFALRKVNGASNMSLLTMILSELFLLLGISLGVGTMSIEMILPAFKQLSQINESTSFFYGEILLYMLLLIGITVIIAVVLVHYINKRTLSESISRKSDIHFSGWFYKGSLLFQLFISIGFIFCTLVIMKQLDYILNTKELGLDRHNVGVIWDRNDFEDIWSNILDQMPDVIDHIDNYETPIPKAGGWFGSISDWDGKSVDEQPIDVEAIIISQEYIDFFGIKILKGEMLVNRNGTDVIINETATKAFGWQDPIGKKFTYNSSVMTVKGVIRDIYRNSPLHPVMPTFFYLDMLEPRHMHYIFRVKEGSWNKVYQTLMDEAKKANPNGELDVLNMNEVYNSYMKSEWNLVKLLSVVSLICIVIAVFGIFSLVTLSCQQRRKEMAIRKVNGASIGVILNMFFKEYMLLLFIASCASFSSGYIIMRHWLEGYMKQTSIDWWLYVVVFLVMALIIFLTIIWRVWKAARQNPAEVIKSE